MLHAGAGDVHWKTPIRIQVLVVLEAEHVARSTTPAAETGRVEAVNTARKMRERKRRRNGVMGKGGGAAIGGCAPVSDLRWY